MMERIDLLCTCQDCLQEGERVKMAVLEVVDGHGRIVVHDKRHGVKHELVVHLDKRAAVHSD
jgi:hypothetical protein